MDVDRTLTTQSYPPHSHQTQPLLTLCTSSSGLGDRPSPSHTSRVSKRGLTTALLAKPTALCGQRTSGGKAEGSYTTSQLSLPS